MTKARRYAKLEDVEVVIRPTPSGVRRVLIAIAEEAAWNAINAEEAGSPQQEDQATIADVLTKAAYAIDAQCKKHWEGR